MTSTTRRVAVAAAAALALADASIVALALPPILTALDTSITGVAAIVGVYALVMAVAILPAHRAVTAYGWPRAGAAGLALFGAASVGCAAAPSLAVLLVMRALQAAGGAVGLIAAFDALEAGATAAGRRLWLGAALAGTAAGPAIGGALTEALDWRAIFAVQAPVAAVAALACLRAPAAPAPPGSPRATAPAGPAGTLWGPPSPGPAGTSSGPAGAPPSPGPAGTSSGPAGAPPSPGFAGTSSGPAGAPPSPGPATRPAAPGRAATPAASLVPAVVLALLAAAFTTVLFLLVLELVAGFAISPLRAAAGVTVLPIAALAGAAVRGPARTRVVAGGALVAGGAAALAFLPEPGLAWTIVPQVLAGAGMGLALPALAGELMPERTSADTARVLLARHAGVVVVLAILAPIVTDRLHDAKDRAVLQGTALVLDAPLPPQGKLALAPVLLDGVQSERPRAGLSDAVDRERGGFARQRAAYSRLAERLDHTVVGAVEDAFHTAYVIAGALALAAAALLLAAGLGRTARPVPAAAAAGRGRAVRPVAVLAAALAAAGCLAVYVVEADRRAPPEVVLRDPCEPRPLPRTGGLGGLAQDAALKLLDRAACQLGSSREELALAIADPGRARAYERKYGVNPRSVVGILRALGG